MEEWLLSSSQHSRTRELKNSRILISLLFFLLGGLAFVQGQVESPPERIISLSPSITEILYGIGAFDRVVAVSDYCEIPPEVEKLPRVGAWMNTNIEQVASLEPDLIIINDAQAPFIQDRLDSLGLASLVVPSQTLADIFEAIETIGRAVSNVDEARALANDTRIVLEGVREKTKDLPRPRVLTVVDRLPGTLRDLYVATQGSYLTEIIEIAGGIPIAPHAAMGYTRISTEAVIGYDPDVILDIAQTVSNAVTLLRGSGLEEDAIAVWNELSDVKAVRNERVYPLSNKLIVHPSQFVRDSVLCIANILHPEVFEN
jgi:iron complex transport system substrate-binding protein